MQALVEINGLAEPKTEIGGLHPWDHRMDLLQLARARSCFENARMKAHPFRLEFIPFRSGVDLFRQEVLPFRLDSGLFRLAVDPFSPGPDLSMLGFHLFRLEVEPRSAGRREICQGSYLAPIRSLIPRKCRANEYSPLRNLPQRTFDQAPQLRGTNQKKNASFSRSFLN
ncbi:MAG: hypothetical protein A2075_24645 [Geobacteraceae bacterium GWC2_58_44]|nr:MAG: hypothetical protein A2075_24645 [Geobacteraceae bacterium GWC2_58_44]HBG07850.1 hypothetical protein [Geobacter sp.]